MTSDKEWLVSQWYDFELASWERLSTEELMIAATRELFITNISICRAVQENTPVLVLTRPRETAVLVRALAKNLKTLVRSTATIIDMQIANASLKQSQAEAEGPDPVAEAIAAFWVDQENDAQYKASRDRAGTP